MAWTQRVPRLSARLRPGGPRARGTLWVRLRVCPTTSVGVRSREKQVALGIQPAGLLPGCQVSVQSLRRVTAGSREAARRAGTQAAAIDAAPMASTTAA